jgi:hypothetical protein
MDDLSFGPIAPPDAEMRRRWVEHELGYEWEDVCAESASFWDDALSQTDRRVAWLSRRSTLEYCGFLEWLWRLGEQPFGLVDLTDVTVVGRAIDGSPISRRADSIGLLHPHEIVDSGFLDSAQEVTPYVRRRYRDVWARLRVENAPLRVLGPDGLVSAPITHFRLASAIARDSRMAGGHQGDWIGARRLWRQRAASDRRSGARGSPSGARRGGPPGI